MAFYVVLLAVNLVCFLPPYLLCARDRPNPFDFVMSGALVGSKLKLLYARPRSCDPFHVHFDFTFALLLAASAGITANWAAWSCSLLLAVGFVEISYTALMSSVFKRPPSLISDLKLASAGLRLAQGHAYWIVPLCVAILAAVAIASLRVTELLLEWAPRGSLAPLLLAALLLPACLYHWKRYGYEEFPARTVYSPALHLWRNIEYGKRLAPLLGRDESYFASRNRFKNLLLRARPTVIVVCVESYGSVVHEERAYSVQVGDLLERHEAALASLGYGFASGYSQAPIFAGGSWLSYISFTYGIRVDDLQLHDALFTRCRAFAAYESLFHVLKRNGYKNVLLCPLGGIDARSVDWRLIRQCFQSDFELGFESVGYRGRLVNYFGMIRRYSPPDQYSLGLAYERARQMQIDPFCLFFCTLNSHYPWHSPDAAVDDWRTLDDTDPHTPWPGADEPSSGRYLRAIRYQLDYLLSFAASQAKDDVLIVLFGDHQPPFLVPASAGKQTPVHVIGKDQAVLDAFLEHGFVPALNLAGRGAGEIRHEGFLSLFLRGMQAAYGADEGPEIRYMPNGTVLFDVPDALSERGR